MTTDVAVRIPQPATLRAPASAAALLQHAAALRRVASELEDMARRSPHGLPRHPPAPRVADLFDDWSTTLATARRTLATANGIDDPSVSSAHGVIAVAAALTGDRELARQEAMLAELRTDRAADSAVAPAVARGLAWLASGVPDVALAALSRVLDPDLHAVDWTDRIAVCGYFAQAATLSGQREAARSLLDRLERPAVRMSDTGRDELAFARALLADDDDFEAAIHEQLRRTSATRQIRRGLLELALGTWLRRARRVSEARSHLEIAGELFEALGHQPWAETARNEARAAGAIRHTASTRHPLSPQELRIARLAADGYSNRDIGKQLYLSPRTVGSHLYRIFPKLDITSRAQLARRLDELERAGDE